MLITNTIQFCYFSSIGTSMWLAPNMVIGLDLDDCLVISRRKCWRPTLSDLLVARCHLPHDGWGHCPLVLLVGSLDPDNYWLVDYNQLAGCWLWVTLVIAGYTN